MTFNQKLRALRTALKLTRKEFGAIVGMSHRTVEILEITNRQPLFDKVEAICKAYPQYTLWLMTDNIDIGAGQISPCMQQPRANQLTKKQASG